MLQLEEYVVSFVISYRREADRLQDCMLHAQAEYENLN